MSCCSRVFSLSDLYSTKLLPGEIADAAAASSAGIPFDARNREDSSNPSKYSCFCKIASLRDGRRTTRSATYQPTQRPTSNRVSKTVSRLPYFYLIWSLRLCFPQWSTGYSFPSRGTLNLWEDEKFWTRHEPQNWRKARAKRI